MGGQAIGYARARRGDTGDAEPSVDDQLCAIREAASSHGWRLADVVVDADVSVADSPSKRPGLGPALEALDGDGADVLVIARLDRLARSTSAWAQLVERSHEHEWTVWAVEEELDLHRDLSQVLAEVARQERQYKSQRVRAGISAARGHRGRRHRRSEHDDAAVQVVREAYAQGATLREIADRLTTLKIKTPRGGRWHASTVRSIINKHGADANLPTVQQGDRGTLDARETGTPDGLIPVVMNVMGQPSSGSQATSEPSVRHLSQQVRSISQAVELLGPQVHKDPSSSPDLIALQNDAHRLAESIDAVLAETAAQRRDEPAQRRSSEAHVESVPDDGSGSEA